MGSIAALFSLCVKPMPNVLSRRCKASQLEGVGSALVGAAVSVSVFAFPLPL